MSTHFGWKAATAICVSCGLYYLAFRAEFRRLAQNHTSPISSVPRTASMMEPSVATLPALMWVAAVHLLLIGWTVVNAHHPPLFIGGSSLSRFRAATRPYQSPIDLKPPLLVGFFLAGLVIHGGLQGWWIEPTLASLSVRPLYYGAMLLIAFNDHALVTYLATLVPSLTEPMKFCAVVTGAVTGGGLTVIANAPNPAGQAILSRFFDGSVLPFGLLLGALVPTAVATLAFMLL